MFNKYLGIETEGAQRPALYYAPTHTCQWSHVSPLPELRGTTPSDTLESVTRNPLVVVQVKLISGYSDTK